MDTIEGIISFTHEKFLEIWQEIIVLIEPNSNFNRQKILKKIKDYTKTNNLPKQVDFYLKSNFLKKLGARKSNYYDAIIIGAGPAGTYCALEAKKKKLSYLIVEKSEILSELSQYPDSMILISESLDFVVFDNENNFNKDINIKELLSYFNNLYNTEELNITTGRKIKKIESYLTGFKLITDENLEFYTLNIIFSAGKSENRKLNVKGEYLNKVYYSYPKIMKKLNDFEHKKICIVGGGISAISLADKLCLRGINVKILIRASSLDRNVEHTIPLRFNKINKFISNGLLEFEFNSIVKEITENEIIYENSITKKIYIVDNEFVFVMIGKVSNYSLLTDLRIDFNNSCNLPILDPKTLETSKSGIFIAGSATGERFFRLFKTHANKIMNEIQKRITETV